jgi:hypothetical protein
MIFSVRVVAAKCHHYSVSMRFSRRVIFFILIYFLLFATVLILPIPWLDPIQYQGYVLAFQAVGILATLGIATVTFRGDSRDRRVDRVLALHNELTSGEVGAARRRLAAHLRQHGPRDRLKQWVLQATTEQLKKQSDLSHYRHDSPKQVSDDKVGAARRRLAAHLRQHGPRDGLKQWVLTEQLKKQSDLSHYRDGGLSQTPSEDAAVLLRFFQSTACSGDGQPG